MQRTPQLFRDLNRLVGMLRDVENALDTRVILAEVQGEADEQHARNCIRDAIASLQHVAAEAGEEWAQ